MTIKGTYENGRIKLDEVPAGVDRARVEVTFILESTSSPSTPNTPFVRRRGMFKREGMPMSTWEDFVEAKRSLFPQREL